MPPSVEPETTSAAGSAAAAGCAASSQHGASADRRVGGFLAEACDASCDDGGNLELDVEALRFLDIGKGSEELLDVENLKALDIHLQPEAPRSPTAAGLI